VAVVERLDPLTLAGRWVPDLVAHAGGRPVLVAPGDPARAVSLDALAEAALDALVVPGKAPADVLHALQVELVRILPPDLLSVPGPGLARAVEVLAAILHPERFEPEGRAWR